MPLESKTQMWTLRLWSRGREGGSGEEPARVPPQRRPRHVCAPTEVGPSWAHTCSSPPQMSSGWPVPYANETDRYGPTAQGRG